MTDNQGTKTWEFYIAGLQYHDYKNVLNLLDKGLELDLEQEPTNKYDVNAVKISLAEAMLGYVPGKFSAEVNAFLEYAENPTCTITQFNKDEKPWKMVKVAIKES